MTSGKSFLRSDKTTSTSTSTDFQTSTVPEHKPIRYQNLLPELNLPAPEETFSNNLEAEKLRYPSPKSYVSSSVFNYSQAPIPVGLNGSGLGYGAGYRRQRGEKKPIPEDQKDDKYFERRRRNNQAAKKSRDARKMREDQIALRATLLEHENSLLRAQVMTLREEASSLRQMLLQKKAVELASTDKKICFS